MSPETYTKFLDKNGLKGARIGILREPMGYTTEPDSEDFKKVTAVFDKAVAELKAAGAGSSIPIVIPAPERAAGAARCRRWRSRSATAQRSTSRAIPNPKFKTMEEVRNSPDYGKVMRAAVGGRRDQGPGMSEAAARDELMIDVMKVMADNKLDAIVHKAVEHTPTLIKDGINPPYVNQKGAPHLNTFLIYVASIAVPAGSRRRGCRSGSRSSAGRTASRR